MTNRSSHLGRQSISIDELIAKSKILPNGCIEWQMTSNRRGYGQVWLKGKMVYVTREICRQLYGNPKAKDLALHSCDYPPCINPEHLSWGNQFDNMRQMRERGRAPKPYYRSGRIMSFEQAELIRAEYKIGLVTKSDLAKKYNMSKTAMNNLLTYKTYAW